MLQNLIGTYQFLVENTVGGIEYKMEITKKGNFTRIYNSGKKITTSIKVQDDCIIETQFANCVIKYKIEQCDKEKLILSNYTYFKEEGQLERKIITKLTFLRIK